MTLCRVQEEATCAMLTVASSGRGTGKHAPRKQGPAPLVWWETSHEGQRTASYCAGCHLVCPTTLLCIGPVGSMTACFGTMAAIAKRSRLCLGASIPGE